MANLIHLPHLESCYCLLPFMTILFIETFLLLWGAFVFMGDDWPSKHKEIAYTESRAVIDAQNTTMTDIDDKAMRTVRLNAVLLGLLVTGLQFIPNMFHDAALQASFVLLILSTVCGVITYNESNLYVGPQGRYIEDLADDNFSDLSWDENLLKTMAGMISKNHDDIQRNAHWLTATQIALVFGIITAVAAVAI